MHVAVIIYTTLWCSVNQRIVIIRIFDLSNTTLYGNDRIYFSILSDHLYLHVHVYTKNTTKHEVKVALEFYDFFCSDILLFWFISIAFSTACTCWDYTAEQFWRNFAIINLLFCTRQCGVACFIFEQNIFRSF